MRRRNAHVIDPRWVLRTYRSHVMPRVEANVLLSPWTAGTGVEEGDITRSLTFQVGVNPVSVAGSVTSTPPEGTYGGRQGKYPVNCNQVDGCDYIDFGHPEFTNNMVSAFWRTETNKGSGDWQGNVLLALWERRQHTKNLKFSFGHSYEIEHR